MSTPLDPDALQSYKAELTKCSASGVSSGAFMAVQLHLAHSSMFVGAGVIAGGPYRCAESFRGASWIAEDAYLQNSLYICMKPLTSRAGPDPERLKDIVLRAAAEQLIDPFDPGRHRVYVFTGKHDGVVDSSVVQATRDFYERLGVKGTRLMFDDSVGAGHAILTTNADDNPLDTNRPPYINRWDSRDMQSRVILEHIYQELEPPALMPTGCLKRFDQREFFRGALRSSMSDYGYVYVPKAVEEGASCRVHVALHGCKQGYNYVRIVNGRPDRKKETPYGKRFCTTTGYNEVADANNIVVLYPQVEAVDDGQTQNPDGCWDWWGYSDPEAVAPDYHSKKAVQICAIWKMLQRLGGQPSAEC